MALTTADLARIKAELGYNVLTVGAIPYVSYVSLFDQIVQPYMQSGASTTSNTVVAAASSPTAVSLTLADIDGFTAGDSVVVDVDALQETATIRAVSGSTISVILSLGHTAGYPVTVDGGEGIVREILKRLRGLTVQIGNASNTAGIKQVDEIQFFGNSVESSQLAMLAKSRLETRDELAAVLGVPNLWRIRRAGGSNVVLY